MEVIDLQEASRRMRVPSDIFSVHVEISHGVARLLSTGRFDSAAVATLEALIGVVRGRDVVIDLDGVTFMDSAGWLGVLDFERRVHDWDREFRLENSPPHIRRIFELTATEYLLSEAVSM